MIRQVQDSKKFARAFGAGQGKREKESRGRNFPGAPEFMRQHGIEVIDLDLPEVYEMFARWIEANGALWNEDIGV